MSNKLRILHKNVARVTGVSSTSVSGAYAASRLLTNDKSEVWRASGTTATLSGSTTALLSASSLHLPHCNFSPTATGRLRLWSDTAATVLARDVGVKLLCPEPAAEVDGWAASVAASAYSSGGGAHGRLWFPETSFKAWTLELSDSSNAQGYLEAADLFIGSYWSPEFDIEQGGGTVTPQDTTTQFRTASGSLKAQRGTRFDEMTLDLTMLTEADRKQALKLLRMMGKRTPFIVSLYPDDSDAERERDHTIYGYLTDIAALSLDGPDAFATALTIAEI